MATTYTDPTPAPMPAPPPAPEPQAGEPSSAYTTVWVHHTGVASVQNRVGWVQCLKTEAAVLIAQLHAQDPYSGQPLKYIGPQPVPPAPPTPTTAPAPSTTDDE